jgi:hypothetical protein
MGYIGSTPTTQSFISGTDYFNGTGAQTAFTLSRSVASINDIQATVNNVVQQPNDAYTISGTTITFTSAPSAGTSNVYVRYLSTTTQAISPSQGTVGWAQLNSDTQQDLGISFKNRIINGAMSVAQYGTSTSVAASANGSYSCDRFRCDSSIGTAITSAQSTSIVPAGFAYSLSYTTGTGTTAAGDNSEIVHFIEGYNIADLGWGTVNAQAVTFSFWARSSLTGNFGLILENGTGLAQYVTTYNIPTANTWTKIVLTIPAPAIGTWQIGNARGIGIRWDMGVGTTNSTAATNAWNTVGSGAIGVTGTVKLTQTTGATFYVTGVQLEVGTQATTFDYRSYGTELSLCQRYFAKTSTQLYGSISGAAGQGAVTWFYKSTMRTAPTVTGNPAQTDVTSTADFAAGLTNNIGGYYAAFLSGSTASAEL